LRPRRTTVLATFGTFAKRLWGLDYPWTQNREELERRRGREIHTTGDGVLAVFDGPARAIVCAAAMVDAVRSLGLEIPAGIHTGEREMTGGEPSGLAVHIGARISALAPPGVVLVSSTVRDLVAGSGLRFAPVGTHFLKGVHGTWQLFSVERP